jgi:DNA primase
MIPYYDRDGKMVFFNGRTMSANKKILRYMKIVEGDQESVLYMTSWPAPGSKIYVMEGELDAITLDLCGFVGCAVGGKYLSDTQVELIRDYKPVLVFDADESGLEALVNVGDALLERGIHGLRYVRPPKAYKDWNKLLVQRNAQTVRAYIERFEKPYTAMTGNLLLSNRL